ncbi:hypothetical protein Tco_0858527 [Tanacetum coccineum]|uniref:Reverse transcriptase domain-containing protein n=1 Tax=Tanacetum coccineum TaxID=301880 RepID=A0ABQ5B9H3_9ASTR
MEPEDSLIMGDDNLSTIPEKESDEVIKSSVEDLVPIPSESEDTSDNDSECDFPFYDDSPPLDVLGGNFMTFSNPLFDANDDFTSSDDESLPEEDVLKDIENKNSYVSNLDEPNLLVTPLSDANKDECFNLGGDIDEINAFLDIDVSTDIEDGYHDSEGDIIYLESLLINNTILNLPPGVFLDHDSRSLKDEPDNDDLMNMVKVFDPGIPVFSLEPVIPSGEIKIHIKVLSVLWGNRLPIPDGSLPLFRYKGLKTKQKRLNEIFCMDIMRPLPSAVGLLGFLKSITKRSRVRFYAGGLLSPLPRQQLKVPKTARKF